MAIQVEALRMDDRIVSFVNVVHLILQFLTEELLMEVRNPRVGNGERLARFS